MDSEHFFIKQGDGSIWTIFHHKPGFPDLATYDGSEADCISNAKRIKAQPAFEMIDFYYIGANRVWQPIENL